jgi:HlyD family secretion protein
VRDLSQINKNSETNADSTSTDSAKTEEGSFIPKEDLRKVVFVIREGKAERQEVKTGISDNTHVQVLSGIENGDQIVIGSYRILSKELNDGDKVNINNNKFGVVASSE